MTNFLPNAIVSNALVRQASQRKSGVADTDFFAFYGQHGSCSIHEIAIANRDYGPSGLVTVDENQPVQLVHEGIVPGIG